MNFDELYGRLVRRDGIIPVPRAILSYFRELNLTPEEVWLIVELLSHRWTRDAPYPSIARLARLRGVPRSTIQRYLQNLRQKGLVAVETRTRGNGARASSLYHLDPLFSRIEQYVLADEDTETPVHIRTPLSGYGQGSVHIRTPPVHIRTGGGPQPEPETQAGQGQTTPLKEDFSRHEESIEEESIEEERSRISGKKLGMGTLADDLCDALHLPRPHHRRRLVKALQQFAAERQLSAPDLARVARRALGTLGPGDAEDVFWRVLERITTLSQKENPCTSDNGCATTTPAGESSSGPALAGSVSNVGEPTVSSPRVS